MLAIAPAKDVGACARLATACRKGVVTDESRLTPVGGGRGGAVDGRLWTCADVRRVLRRRHSVVSAAQPSGQLASWPRGLLLLDADRVGCPVMDFGSFAPGSLPVRMRTRGLCGWHTERSWRRCALARLNVPGKSSMRGNVCSQHGGLGSCRRGLHSGPARRSQFALRKCEAPLSGFTFLECDS